MDWNSLISAVVGGSLAISAQGFKHLLDERSRKKRNRAALKSFFSYYREELTTGKEILDRDIALLSDSKFARLSPSGLPHNFWDGFHLSEEHFCLINEIGNEEERNLPVHLSRCFSYITMSTDTYKRMPAMDQINNQRTIDAYYQSALGGYNLTIRLIDQLVKKL